MKLVKLYNFTITVDGIIYHNDHCLDRPNDRDVKSILKQIHEEKVEIMSGEFEVTVKIEEFYIVNFDKQ